MENRSTDRIYELSELLHTQSQYGQLKTQEEEVIVDSILDYFENTMVYSTDEKFTQLITRAEKTFLDDGVWDMSLLREIHDCISSF